MVTDPPYGVEYDAGWRNGTPNGLALWRLGERESGTGRLEEAVTAYRAALEEQTRERVPLDWAMTQNNLGNALERLDRADWREAWALFPGSVAYIWHAGTPQPANYSRLMRARAIGSQ